LCENVTRSQAVVETLSQMDGIVFFDFTGLDQVQAKHSPHGSVSFGCYSLR